MFTKYHMRLREDATVALTAVAEVRARPLLRCLTSTDNKQSQLVLTEVIRAALVEAEANRLTPQYLLNAITKHEHLAPLFENVRHLMEPRHGENQREALTFSSLCSLEFPSFQS